LFSTNLCKLLLLIIFRNTFQLTRTKKGGENIPYLYELEGNETLGSYLQIQPCSDNAPEVSKCSIQWYRVSSDGAKKELISNSFSVLFYFFQLAIWLALDLCISSTYCIAFPIIGHFPKRQITVMIMQILSFSIYRKLYTYNLFNIFHLNVNYLCCLNTND